MVGIDSWERSSLAIEVHLVNFYKSWDSGEVYTFTNLSSILVPVWIAALIAVDLWTWLNSEDYSWTSLEG